MPAALAAPLDKLLGGARRFLEADSMVFGMQGEDVFDDLEAQHPTAFNALFSLMLRLF